MKKAVLLVGHGSRRQEANDSLVLLGGLLEKRRPGTMIAHGFLQFAEPALPAALARLAEAGVAEVTVMPVFLYEGIHIKEDIPQFLAEAAQEYPHIRLVVAPVLGIDERMAEIIWDRVDAAPQS